MRLKFENGKVLKPIRRNYDGSIYGYIDITESYGNQTSNQYVSDGKSL